MKYNNINITVISNLSERDFIVNSIKRCLYDQGIESEIYYHQYIYNMDEKLEEQISLADITIVWLSFLYANDNACLNLVDGSTKIELIQEGAMLYYSTLFDNIISTNTNMIVAITDTNYLNIEQTVYGPVIQFSNFIDELNYKLFNKYFRDITFINLNQIVGMVGIRQAITRPALHKWGILYTKEVTDEIAHHIYKLYQTKVGKLPKCIILDCDNVLWKGIISEDGINGIILASEGEGKAYKKFQELLAFLYKNGIILAICSKNNLDDILEVFIENKQMILKEEMISVFKVNWNLKSINIGEIVEELNIDISSVIFVDDDDYEVLQVKKVYPQLTVVKFDVNNIDYIFENCYLPLWTDFNVNMTRQRVYYENQLRNNQRIMCNSNSEYLKLLGTQIDINEAKIIELARISELTLRTNKCTNGKRYTERDVQHLYEDTTADVYTVHVKDNFGDLGLVGCMAIRNNTIVLFSLSCRALGRNIENILIDFIKSKYGICTMLFAHTGKNQDIYELMNKEMAVMLVEL